MNNPVKNSVFNTLVPLSLLLALLVLPADIMYTLLISIFFYGVYYVKYRHASNTFKWILFLGITLRILLVVADEFFGPVVQVQTDTVMYCQEALSMIENRHFHMPVYYNALPGPNLRTFSLVISYVFEFFGAHVVVVRLLNVWVNIISITLIYKISLMVLKNERMALWSMGFATFWPTIIVFMSYALRDSIILLLNLLFVYIILLILKRRYLVLNVLLLGPILLLNYVFRQQNLYLFISMIGVFYVLLLLKSDIRFVFKFIFVFLLFLTGYFLFSFHQEFIVKVLTYPLRAQPLRVEGGSAYLMDLEIHNYWDMVKYLPLRFLYFTFGPFLWNVSTFFQLMTALEGVGLLLTFAGFVRYFYLHGKDDEQHLVLFLYLFCILGLLANSMVDSNFGTAVRHRLNFVIFFFIFCSAYLDRFRIRWVS